MPVNSSLTFIQDFSFEIASKNQRYVLTKTKLNTLLVNERNKRLVSR